MTKFLILTKLITTLGQINNWGVSFVVEYLGILGDQCIVSMELGSTDPPLTHTHIGASVGEGGSFSPKLFPWVSQNYLNLFVSFDSLRPRERFVNCVWTGLHGLTSTKNINVYV